MDMNVVGASELFKVLFGLDFLLASACLLMSAVNVFGCTIHKYSGTGVSALALHPGAEGD
jgi:hypothetical protein